MIIKDIYFPFSFNNKNQQIRRYLFEFRGVAGLNSISGKITGKKEFSLVINVYFKLLLSCYSVSNYAWR